MKDDRSEVAQQFKNVAVRLRKRPPAARLAVINHFGPFLSWSLVRELVQLYGSLPSTAPRVDVEHMPRDQDFFFSPDLIQRLNGMAQSGLGINLRPSDMSEFVAWTAFMLRKNLRLRGASRGISQWDLNKLVEGWGCETVIKILNAVSQNDGEGSVLSTFLLIMKQLQDPNIDLMRSVSMFIIRHSDSPLVIEAWLCLALLYHRAKRPLAAEGCLRAAKANCETSGKRILIDFVRGKLIEETRKPCRAPPLAPMPPLGSPQDIPYPLYSPNVTNAFARALERRDLSVLAGLVDATPAWLVRGNRELELVEMITRLMLADHDLAEAMRDLRGSKCLAFALARTHDSKALGVLIKPYVYIRSRMRKRLPGLEETCDVQGKRGGFNRRDSIMLHFLSIRCLEVLRDVFMDETVIEKTGTVYRNLFRLLDTNEFATGPLLINGMVSLSFASDNDAVIAMAVRMKHHLTANGYYAASENPKSFPIMNGDKVMTTITATALAAVDASRLMALGQLEYRKRNYRLADSYFKRVIQLTGKRIPDGFIWRALTLSNMDPLNGFQQGHRKYCERLLMKFPRHDMAKLALEALKLLPGQGIEKPTKYTVSLTTLQQWIDKAPTAVAPQGFVWFSLLIDAAGIVRSMTEKAKMVNRAIREKKEPDEKTVAYIHQQGLSVLKRIEWSYLLGGMIWTRDMSNLLIRVLLIGGTKQAIQTMASQSLGNFPHGFAALLWEKIFVHKIKKSTGLITSKSEGGDVNVDFTVLSFISILNVILSSHREDLLRLLIGATFDVTDLEFNDTPCPRCVIQTVLGVTFAWRKAELADSFWKEKIIGDCQCEASILPITAPGPAVTELLAEHQASLRIKLWPGLTYC